MQINKELTKAIPIQRHRESDTPIVFEFVHTDQTPYTVTGTWEFLVGRKVIAGTVATNRVTFALSDEDRATLPAVQNYQIVRTLSGVDAVPFMGTLTMSVAESDYASFELPIIQVTIDESGNITGGITVIVGPQGPQGEPGTSYTESEEFTTLAAQVQGDAEQTGLDRIATGEDRTAVEGLVSEAEAAAELALTNAGSGPEALARVEEITPLLPVDLIENDERIVAGWATKEGKVLLGVSDDGSITNPDYEDTKTKANTSIADAAEALAIAETLADGIEAEANINEHSIEWAKVDKEGKVLIGVTGSGKLINPEFEALRDAFNEAVLPTQDTPLTIEDTKILFGPHLFLVAGREVDLYGASLLKTRVSNNNSYTFALQSVNAEKVPFQALFQEWLRLNPDWLGATATIKLRNPQQEKEHSKAVTVVKSAADKTATPTVLCIGDSLTQGSMSYLLEKFAGTSVTPTFIGTRLVAGHPYSEGRGGWEASNFVHIETDRSPITVGAESIPVGIDNNPFIRAATGGDDAGDVKNGYIFDFRFYLDRFGFDDPDIVTINLGTNDLGENDKAAAVVKVIEGIRIMVKQIKAACPDCVIGIALPMNANDADSIVNWEQGFVPIFLSHHENYGDRGGEDIYLISSHATQTNRFIFPTTVESTDSQTGETIEVLSDPLHMTHLDFGANMFQESIFTFIHAIS